MRILIYTRFASMPFVRREQDLSYCRLSRDATDAKTEVAKEALSSLYRFFNKSYANLYFLHCSTHWKIALELVVCQRRAMRNLVVVGWHKREIFGVPVNDQYHY